MTEEFKVVVSGILNELGEKNPSLNLDAFSTVYSSETISITLDNKLLCAVSEVFGGGYNLAHFVDGERQVEYPKNQDELKVVVSALVIR